MVTANIRLSDTENRMIQHISSTTGKTPDVLLHEAIAQFIARVTPHNRLSLLRQARGMWKDREDAPDAAALRQEWDRWG